MDLGSKERLRCFARAKMGREPKIRKRGVGKEGKVFFLPLHCPSFTRSNFAPEPPHGNAC